MGLELSERLQQLRLTESERKILEYKLTQIIQENNPAVKVGLLADFAALMKPYFKEQKPIAWKIYNEVITDC